MDDAIGSFFEELKALDADVSAGEPEKPEAVTTPAPNLVVASKVIAKPAERVIRATEIHSSPYESVNSSSSNAVDTTAYGFSAHSYPSTASSSSSHAPQPPPPVVPHQNKVFVRTGAGEVWIDNSLNEWPENDYRIFVGDLAKDVTTEHLTEHFQQYKSFAKAKVMRTKFDDKAKGYGFVSFLDPMDCAKAIREQNGKYLCSRPMKITKSTWNERDIKEVKKKEAKKRKLQESLGLA